MYVSQSLVCTTVFDVLDILILAQDLVGIFSN
jgi:hypothetical protein